MKLQIVNVLRESANQLSQYSDTPQLDAELLLAHTLAVPRSYLHTWPERELRTSQRQQFLQLLARRIAGEPVAYLLGHKEFWSLILEVTADTLVPRPETELLVELILEKLPADPVQRVVDLGTGSGAIALAIASERPHWEVWAVDRMPKTLAIAERNAQRLGINNVIFQLGNWCSDLPKQYFHAVVSNPPYIAENDHCLSQVALRFEPVTALVSGQDGFRDLQIIIQQAPACLLSGGYLLLEHGYDQKKSLVDFLLAAGYVEVVDYQDIAICDRAITAKYLSHP